MSANAAQERADEIKARRENERPVAVGDLVRIGRGRSTWRVDSFWTAASGVELVHLQQVDGYTATSVHAASLVLVEKAGSPS